MAGPLFGRSFIVTGGFSGIGLATTRKLLDLSATVHAIDRTATPPSDLASVSKNLYLYGGVDVSSRDSVSETFRSVIDRSPELSGVVNSAGICPLSDTLIEKDSIFQDLLAVNVGGTWNVATAYLGYIQTKIDRGGSAPKGASLVNIGSSASLKGYSSLAGYTASKHAVLGLTRSWAIDFAPLGVRVNLVAPGGTKTPMSAMQVNDKGRRGEMSARALMTFPMGRFGEPQELAEVIVFLLSDHASYVTGQALAVNGGEV